MFETARTRLAKDALNLKQAWLFAMAWLGQGGKLSRRDLTIPDYKPWKKQDLVIHIKDLREDFAFAVGQILLKPNTSLVNRLATWMSDQFSQWQGAGGGLLSLCTAQEFEKRFGHLKCRESVEVPPYAEMLMQGWHGLAIRHPEYMLARDLSFMYSLWCDAKELLSEVDRKQSPPEWAKHGSENSQAIARSVLLGCFNLLESFVSGLARSYVMISTALDPQTEAKLLDNKQALKRRLLLVPRLITGRDSGLDDNKPPMSILFGDIKKRRDSFVHCEPGPQASTHGYVKERLFHDVSQGLVDNAVELTSTIIHYIWKHIYGTDGPRWLPEIRPDTCSLKSLRLTSYTPTSSTS